MQYDNYYEKVVMQNIKPTLPIDILDGLNLDIAVAKDAGVSLHETYINAEPFPHIVIDQFLPDKLISKILENFPQKKVNEEVIFDGGYLGHHKRQIPPAQCNGFNRELFAFFNSAATLKFLESISGIKGLLPDPYFNGGGYHEISRGGLLGIHADFRLNKQLNLHRRINLLIYLNEGWDEAWGGQLELWDKAMQHKVKGIFPLINRCVIFNTDADSYHGHPDPLNCPDHITRKSIALYYYTASTSIRDEIPAHGTMYKARPDDNAATKLEASMLRFDNYIADLLPPFLARFVFKVKNKIKMFRQK